MLLEMFMSSNNPLSLLVIAWGGAGTGKTTVARRLIVNAKSLWNLETIYLDAETGGHHGFFTALQRVQDLKGHSAVELFKLLEENGSKILIVIDNAETILQRKKLIQAFSRIGEAFPHRGFFIFMLFRSRSIPIDVTAILPPGDIIHFKPYLAEEIHEILIDALKDYGHSVNEKALDIISRMADGDAGLALQILKLSLNIANSKNIDETHVLEALRKLSGNYLTLMPIQICDPHTEIVLRIISEYSEGIRLRRLFEKYRRTAEASSVKPLGYTQLWKKIRMLENKMLLDFEVVNLKDGRTGIVRGRCTSRTTIS